MLLRAKLAEALRQWPDKSAQGAPVRRIQKIAGVFARELSVGVLGLGLVVLIGWALFAGIAALPISVAVVFGALIIASALRR